MTETEVQLSHTDLTSPDKVFVVFDANSEPKWYHPLYRRVVSKLQGAPCHYLHCYLLVRHAGTWYVLEQVFGTANDGIHTYLLADEVSIVPCDRGGYSVFYLNDDTVEAVDAVLMEDVHAEIIIALNSALSFSRRATLVDYVRTAWFGSADTLLCTTHVMVLIMLYDILPLDTTVDQLYDYLVSNP